MKVFLSVTLLGAGLLTASAQSYLITLSPEGGGGRTGSGSGSLTLSGNTLTLNSITYSGLSANSTLAHFHGPSGPFPATAGVLYNLASYTTLGGTEGVFNGTLTLVDNPNSRGFTVAEQIDQLNTGQWYLNIHSTAFGGGEIRGTVELVPEPTTWGLLGLGLGALLWRVRRR